MIRCEQVAQVFAADEYTSATYDLERLLEFAQGQQGSTFPGLVQQCQEQRASLLEVGPCLCMYWGKPCMHTNRQKEGAKDRDR